MFMDKLNYGSDISIYFEHIARQLIKNMVSDANFDMAIKRYIHTDKKLSLTEELKLTDNMYNYDADIYIKSISALASQDLDYYLKNLKIIAEENKCKLVNLEYDYYALNEPVSDTDIQFIYS